MVDYMRLKNSLISRRKNFVHPTEKQIERWLILNKISYKNTQKGQFRVCNPDGDTKFSMEISKSKALVHDFRVNHKQYDGSFIRFVSNYKGISIEEAIEEVCGNNKNFKPILIEDEEDEEDVEHEINLPSGSLSLRDHADTKSYEIVYNYLTKYRGLDHDTIMKANVHYFGTSVVIPYYEYGMIVFWQMRYQLSKKFLFPPSSSKSAGDFLYGFDNVEPRSFVIISEAIYDALSIGDDCVATGGASLKKGQIELLKILSPSEIILAPDNDGAGVASVKRDYMSLYKGDWVISYCLPPYVEGEDKIDWNDMKNNKLDPREYILSNKRKLSMKDVFNGIDYKSFKY